MRVVFMGTPEFAVPSLRALASTHTVVAVYTRPDAVSGRGSTPRPTPVTSLALELGLYIRHPATLRDPAEQDALRALAPDLIVVAAYGLILPPEVLAVAPLGSVNVHASLLPRWRGAAPVQRAILAGDKVTGVSIMRMEAGLDTGPYCLQVSTPVADKTADALTAELAEIGADALVRSLPSIEAGTANWIEQDPALVTYADKIAKADVALQPSLTAAETIARVRASSRSAPARASVAGRSVTVTEVAPAPGAGFSAGDVAVTRDAVLLGVRDGAVAVLRVKPEGKAEMAAADWARGVKDLAGSRWESLT